MTSNTVNVQRYRAKMKSAGGSTLYVELGTVATKQLKRLEKKTKLKKRAIVENAIACYDKEQK